MLGIFPDLDGNKLYFSRAEKDQLLGTRSPHAFMLEDALWPTVEHYFQASKYLDENYRERIRKAETPEHAYKLGNSIWRHFRIRRDWKTIREVIMTRGVYIKCRTHADVAAALLATDDQELVENSLYDYYWGCGRDRRGHNHYGKVLMKVRKRLRNEQQGLS